MDNSDHETVNEIVNEEVNIQEVEEPYSLENYEIPEENEVQEVEEQEEDSLEPAQEDVIEQENDAAQEEDQENYQDSGVVMMETVEDPVDEAQEYEEVYNAQEEVAVGEDEFDEAQEVAEEEIENQEEEVVQEEYQSQDSPKKEADLDQEEVQQYSEEQEFAQEEVEKGEGEEEQQEEAEEAFDSTSPVELKDEEKAESTAMNENKVVEDEEAARDSDNEQENEEAAETKSQSDDEYDNVVEVEEHKAGSGGEDENVAQHISDSENEEDAKVEEIKLGDMSEDDLRGASSGSEDEASEDDNNTTPTKRKNAVLSSDEEENQAEKVAGQKKEGGGEKMFDSDSEGEQKEEGVGDLIADIFGESDDEEEFTGFGQEEVSKKPGKPVSAAISDSEEEQDAQVSDDEVPTESKPAKKSAKGGEESEDSDEGVRDKSEEMSDFDLMMKRKKEANRRRRNRKDGGTLISDADDIINAMLIKMKESAEADREANQKRQPALKKLKMLPTVILHLKKQDLKEAFVDNGVIAAIADWLSILPDRSLPHITIRTELLKILHDLPAVGAETLKQSGIGRSVMILFKHPRESRSNKDMAGRLINKWSRPIFGLNENFKSMSREEREQRDLDQMPQAKRRKLSAGTSQGQGADGRVEGELGQLRPGEHGFVMRARVPMPSTKDYVVRPKWNVQTGAEMDEDEPRQVSKRRRSAGAPRSSKKDERLEKHLRNFAERKKNSKLQRAVKISIEGNKMSIV